ncbi:Hypothetical protein PHPALM_100 [Phytophthora palmivora]|uniref:Tf2-1-like SH3-like domain-containing protein n=1 Tax=Phytophthora palmivora TaxID=4796 RepID=A0A2P4YVM6_9STRA|nr:Hypothetical protein PHPALM_100 [Phytophthora palmivora]
MYVQDLDQRDWDEYAERITFAINTAHDRIRGETPFYMVHEWDPRSTLEAVIPVGKQLNQRLREAISDRADLHNQETSPHQIEVGSRVWLYLNRVKEGYATKLAHLWHGPFRIVEKVGEQAVKLEIAGSGYHVFPVVHVTKLKPVKEYPDRPLIRLTIYNQGIAGSKIVIPMSTKWRRSRIRDQDEERDMDGFTVNSSCTGEGMMTQLGCMKRVSTVALCYTSFCEIARITIDSV